MKLKKNPAAVANALNGLPCSNASGINVSASDASTAPPANASATPSTSSLSAPAVARPSTTAAASSTAHATQVAITVRGLIPEDLMLTAPTSDSGRFEKK